MANRGPQDYVSATAAAYRLGVSTRTLRRYAQQGRLPDARLRAVVTAQTIGGGV
jgi:predicted site-specific integrase-resolvase